MTLRDVFTSVDDPAKLALVFDYEWRLARGDTVSFAVVDVMALDAAGRVRALEIFYDASEARARLGRARERPASR